MRKYPLSSQILNDVEFEMAFFSHIADSVEFDIIPIPYDDGYVITDEEYLKIMEEAKKNDVVVLFRISYGNSAIVYNPLNGRTGLVPEHNASGFEC